MIHRNSKNSECYSSNNNIHLHSIVSRLEVNETHNHIGGGDGEHDENSYSSKNQLLLKKHSNYDNNDCESEKKINHNQLGHYNMTNNSDHNSYEKQNIIELKQIPITINTMNKNDSMTTTIIQRKKYGLSKQKQMDFLKNFKKKDDLLEMNKNNFGQQNITKDFLLRTIPYKHVIFINLASTKLQLFNDSDKKMIFKLKTTVSEVIASQPCRGIIEPHSYVQCQLTPIEIKHRVLLVIQYANYSSSILDLKSQNYNQIWNILPHQTIHIKKLQCIFELSNLLQQQQQGGQYTIEYNNKSVHSYSPVLLNYYQLPRTNHLKQRNSSNFLRCTAPVRKNASLSLKQNSILNRQSLSIMSMMKKVMPTFVTLATFGAVSALLYYRLKRQ
ncbi:unnamed protein product [Didymodactylos carnosus]|uniref:MSP domain-containing protein n=1 Tax=Didymodactylos carnosus TaxID=1234261 RepID=A0A8S2K8S3_9BILA|nr:unnamed protein product [Didymodactylos carnosus]CAF3834109.1 unnamed protein product [Didymodactylos carnosus]